MKENTPEDTWDLEKANTRSKVSKNWNIISASVENKTKYWVFVEKWVKNKEYKYNKPRGNIFKRQVWARMFQTAHFQLKGKFNTYISLWKKNK